jgi:hypothetical protein
MDAGLKKEKRNNRGTNPNSIAALIPVKKGEVRSPKGRKKGTPEHRTAYRLGFNPRGASDFDAGVEHRELFENQKALLAGIIKLLSNKNGELALFHSSDIEIRYETEVLGIPTTATGYLSDILTRLESATGIKILHVKATKDLIKDFNTTANALRQTISDINDVLGNKQAPAENVDHAREKAQFRIYQKVILFFNEITAQTGQLPTVEQVFNEYSEVCNTKNLTLTDREIKQFWEDNRIVEEEYRPQIQQLLEVNL